MDGSVCWLLLETFGKKLRGRREEAANVSNFWKKVKREEAADGCIHQQPPPS